MNPYVTLKGYDLSHLTVGTLGGHSALDVCHGAKRAGFQTLVVAQKGRERTYGYYRSRTADRGQRTLGCVDQLVEVAAFKDILKDYVQAKLKQMNTIFIQSRYFWVYMEDYGKVESDFGIPLFGSRYLLKLEERTQPYNQYHLLMDAKIRMPRIFADPKDLDGTLCIVKVNEAIRGYERAFFFAADKLDYDREAESLLKAKVITEEALKAAVIEEFVVGAPVNFNFFYSPLSQELELLGTDTRRQTNLDGYLRLTATEQLRISEKVQLKMIETGHIAVTVKESLLEKAYDMGERFVRATRRISKKIDPTGYGIIGPFALQGAVVTEKGSEDIVIFDVSLRIPGSPGTFATPYSRYLYGHSVSAGERIGMELRRAVEEGRLEEVVT